VLQEQAGQPKEDDLGNWGLHSGADTVPDECMQLCGTKDVSFVFSCKVTGKEIPADRPILGGGSEAPAGVAPVAAKVLSVRDTNVPTQVAKRAVEQDVVIEIEEERSSEEESGSEESGSETADDESESEYMSDE